MQAAFLGAIYKGAQSLRVFVQNPTHPLVLEKPEITGAMRDTLSQLAFLDHPVAMQVVLEKCCNIVRMGESRDLKAQSSMSRMIADVENDIKHMLGSVDVTSSDKKFRLVQVCKEEVVPLLTAQLDDVLHNHLLDRAPRR